MSVHPPSPPDEPERLSRLTSLAILDTAPEPLFYRFARMAAEACGTPLGFLSLVGDDSQWFKASFGFSGSRSTPRRDAFCAYTILGSDVLVVPDSQLDERFASNPSVVDDPRVRFYAGAPLGSGQGSAVGTVCVVDHEPRDLSQAQRRQLAEIAAAASDALEMRRRLLEQARHEAARRNHELAESQARYEALIETQSELVSLARPDGRLIYVNAAYARHHGCEVSSLIGTNLLDKVPVEDRSTVQARIETVLTTGVAARGHNRVIGSGGQVQTIEWTNSRQRDSAGEPVLHSVGRDITDRVLVEEALRERESFLDRTGRAAGVGGWQYDVQRGVLTWSLRTRRIHEVPDEFVPSLDEALGFYPPESRCVIEAAVARGMEQGTPWDLELPFTTYRGRSIFVRAVGEVEFEGGAAVRLVGAFQDITERRQLQDRVESSERFLRRVADSVPLRIAYLDLESRYRFLNEAHCQRFGRPKESLLGRTRAELLGSETPQIEERLRLALGGEPQLFEYDEIVHGSARRIESRLVPDLTPEGGVMGVFTVGVDITERTAAQQALRELSAIIASSEDLVVQTDRAGRITYLNNAARRAVGLGAEQSVVDLSLASFTSPDARRAYFEVALPVLLKQGSWIGDTTLHLAPGRSMPVSQVVLAHRDARGRVARFSAVMRDETAKVQAAQETLRQQATLRSVAEAIPACVAVVGRDRRYRYVNRAFETWRGLERGEILGKFVETILDPQQYLALRPAIDSATSGEVQDLELEDASQPASRLFAVKLVPLPRVDGESDGFVCIMQDVTEQRSREARLTALSERDALTGLHNRASLDDRLAKLARDGKTSGLALLYLDLDHFKVVNDVHGHPVGDELLKQFAKRLKTIVRPTDFVARIGGDEFVILLSDLREASHAAVIAEKVVDAARQPFHVAGTQLAVGASVGVAFGGAEAHDPPRLVSLADQALYEVKRSGRSGYRVARG